MPPKRVPWIKVEVPMFTHRKLADLPNDSARWGWLYLLGRAKVQTPQGRFASVGQLREEAGRFARYIPKWTEAGLLDAPSPDGSVTVHDWQRYQVDPTNADRQHRHRNGDGNAERNAESNGDRNGSSRAYARRETRQETDSPPDGGESARAILPLELAGRRLLNGGGTDRQIDVLLGLGEQVGENVALRVCGEWETQPIRDRFGGAMAELRDLAARGKGKRRAVAATTNYDRLMQSDDDEPAGVSA